MVAKIAFPKTRPETHRADAMRGMTIRLIGAARDVDGKGPIAAAAPDRARAGRPQTRLHPVAWPTRVHYFKNETVGRANKQRQAARAAHPRPSKLRDVGLGTAVGLKTRTELPLSIPPNADFPFTIAPPSGGHDLFEQGCRRLAPVGSRGGLIRRGSHRDPAVRSAGNDRRCFGWGTRP
jgi:hypothetical protein